MYKRNQKIADQELSGPIPEFDKLGECAFL